MEININEVSNYLLAEVLKLQADVKVLQGTVSALMQIVKPEAYDAYLQEKASQQLSVLQELLLDHPFYEGPADDLIRQIFYGSR